MTSNKNPIPPSLGEPRKVPTERPGPLGGKRDENRRQRTRDLSEAAIALFLEKGIEATTIDDIVQRAGIAKGSFYRYFADKADVVDALFAPVATMLDEAFNESYAELAAARTQKQLIAGYETFAARLTGLLLENSEIVRLYLQENRAPGLGARKPVVDLHNAITQHALKLTDAAASHNLLKSDNPKVTALAVVGAVERLLYAFVSGEELGDLMSVSNTVIKLVLDGLFVRVEE